MRKQSGVHSKAGKTFILATALYSTHFTAKADLYDVLIKAGDYIMGKVIEGIDGAVMDAAERMVTREGESISSAGAV